MLRIAAAVLAAALTVPVSPAHATTDGQCFFAVAQVRGSGLTHRGAILGYALDDAGGAVNLRCYLTVNGDVEDEAFGSGTGFALAVAPVEVFIRDTDDVDICTQINGFTDCEDGTKSLVPPPAVVNLLCTVTSTIGGMGFDVLGLVRIEPDGHVYVANVLVWYCRESATVYYKVPGL